MPELPTLTETLRRCDRARKMIADLRGEIQFRRHALRSGERVCPHGQPCPTCKAMV